MRQNSHSGQRPWDGEAANLSDKKVPRDDRTERRRRRKLRRRKQSPVLLTGTLVVAAGLGAGVMIFPDRAADLLRGHDWMRPSAAWSVVFPEQGAPVPFNLAQMERRPAAAPVPAPAEEAGRSAPGPALVMTAANYPATTSSIGRTKEGARDLPWLPDSVKPAEAPASEPVQIAPRLALASPEVAPTVPAPRPSPAAPAPLTEEAANLIKLARGRIELGDVAGARLLLERAASGREPNALMALAETYDPAMLARWGARGLKGDIAKARELYQTAAESGLAEARTRVLAVR